MHLIELVEDQIINIRKEARLPVSDGFIGSDVPADILKLAVVERRGRTGGIGIGFVRGFILTSGALASSVSHDHHNIVCVAVNAVADGGELIGSLPTVPDLEITDN